MANTKRLIALKTFEGAEREGRLVKGQGFDASQGAAQGYIANGLAKEMPGPPSQEDAERATASDAEQKAEAKRKKEAEAEAKKLAAAETKETGRAGVAVTARENKGR